jgi:DNA modification methylase
MTGRVIVLRGDAAHLPLPDASVDLVATSPPYWSQRDYRDGGESLKGQIGNEPTWQEYLANLLDCTREWVRVLKPSGSIFVVIGDKYANDAKWGGATSGKHVKGLHGQTGIGRVKVRTGIPAKSLIGLPARYEIACIDELGLICRRDNIWHKTSGMPESVDDRCATRHEYAFHLTVEPQYFAAIDEIREVHASASVARSRRKYNAGDCFSPGTPNTLDPARFVNPAGALPGSVWPIAAQPLNVPEWLEHGRCCGGRKRPGCDKGLDHHAAFPPALVKKIILGWSPSGICLECGEGRWPVPNSRGLDMSRPQARRAHYLAQRAGLTEEHLCALLSVGISDTGRGAATQNGTGRNTPEVYALAAEARAALGGYAREYLLRRPTAFAYACACTPYTDHPERRGKDFHAGTDRAVQGMNDGNGGERYRRYMEELANPRGPVREYHFDRWTPAPTRPALVVDPFGGTGTTALVASVLGRTGITVDRSMDYARLAQWRTSDPGERARALGVPKPPPVPEGQASLFNLESA